MSASPLVTNIMTSVQTAMQNNGIPALYAPSLENIIVAVLTELSTDPLVPASAQAVFVTQIALTAPDAAP